MHTQNALSLNPNTPPSFNEASATPTAIPDSRTSTPHSATGGRLPRAIPTRGLGSGRSCRPDYHRWPGCRRGQHLRGSRPRKRRRAYRVRGACRVSGPDAASS
eukprot:scaffold1662_cov118-Isochrysis_galbana.AAC.1